MLPSLFTKPIGAAEVARAKTLPRSARAKSTRSADASDEGEYKVELPPLRALRRIVLTSIHFCPECSRETEVNCGQFVEFKVSGSDPYRTRVFRASEWEKWQHLATTIETLGVETKECPRCLGLRPQRDERQMEMFAIAAA